VFKARFIGFFLALIRVGFIALIRDPNFTGGLFLTPEITIMP
jgi:hypothetical protein